MKSYGEAERMDGRTYIAIDLKSFYASVECMERGLDPLTTNLVVADKSRTEKTICLAVSPSLKVYDIPGRPRLFEVVQKVREVNARRRRMLRGTSLREHPARLRIWKRIRLWRWTILLRRLRWRVICRSAARSMRSI